MRRGRDSADPVTHDRHKRLFSGYRDFTVEGGGHQGSLAPDGCTWSVSWGVISPFRGHTDLLWGGRKGGSWGLCHGRTLNWAQNRASAAPPGWKRTPLIMRRLFYPPALHRSRRCGPPIISALEPGHNNEFTETEKCRGLNCMYLVTQTEAMAWERLVSQWHHLATQPL